MRDVIVLKIVGIVCVTILGVTYFITVRQDSTVLLSLSSVIGGLVGFQIGIKIGRRRR